MIRRLAIVPARSGSKRIKNKNIKNFCGQPIINITISNLLKSKLFHTIHVSTDSNKIKKVVEKKINIDFLRPIKLSQDSTSTFDVLKYVVEEYENKNIFFQEVWLVNACSPLINHKDYKNALKIFKKKNSKFPLMPICQFPVPIEWAYKKLNDSTVTPINYTYVNKRSQLFKKKYYEIGSFIIFPLSYFKSNKINKKFISYELPRHKSVDIDDLNDWKFAEKLFKINNL